MQRKMLSNKRSRRKQSKAKNKASDFSKKKGRVGKGKQVPENATQISFKSQNVVLPCQWENSDLKGPTSHRKQSLQVLFNKVCHHNSSVRRDALLGLRDVFQLHMDICPKYLPKLVEYVFITFVDNSSAVRQASHLLLETLLSSVGKDTIGPFFGTLIAQLNCGLTHISEKIQLDSLRVLELFLKHCSGSLEAYVGDIVLVLIGLLSRQKSRPAPSPRSTKAKKGQSLIGILGGEGASTLVNNPSSDLLNQTCRLRLLKLISSLLELLLEAAPGCSSPHDDTFDGAGFGKVCGGGSTLVSILVETWVESHVEDVFRGRGGFVQSLCLMEAVLTLLCILLKLLPALTNNYSEGKQEAKLQAVDCCKKIGNDISSHMLHHFPFRVASSSLQKHLQQLYIMNFTFCEISLLLWKLLSPARAGLFNSEFSLAALQYLSSLNSSDIASVVRDQACSKMTVSLVPFLYGYSLAEPQVDCVGGAFTFMKNFYVACHPHSRSKRILVQSLCAVFLEELDHGESNSVVMTQLLLPWSSSLLDLLEDLGSSNPETTSMVLDAIAAAATRGSAALISQLQKKLLPILETCREFLCVFPESTQRKMVGLLWHLSLWDEVDLGVLSRLINCGVFSIRVQQYLIQVIHHKYMREDLGKDLFTCTPAYLSFMLTILVGFNIPGEPESADTDLEGNKLLVSVARKSKEAIRSEDYIALHQTVCDCLKATSISTSILSCLEEALLGLSKCCCLPVNTVGGILTLGCSFGPLVEQSDSLISVFGQLSVSSMLASSYQEPSAAFHGDLDAVAAGDFQCSHCDHTHHADRELLQCYLRLSYQIMISSPGILEAVVCLFGKVIASSGSEIGTRHLIEVLACLDSQPVLWKARNRFKGPLKDILVSLVSTTSPVGVRKELELAIHNFLKV